MFDSMKLAILDDYASIAPTAFSYLSDITTDTFPETLDARTTDGAAALVERLKPYPIISTMRERTIFSRETLSQLPNLKLLLTTGPRNASIDVAACKELGITLCGTGPKPNAVKGYDATNEQTWALILGLAKGVARDDYTVKHEDGWQNGLGMGLAGKTLGLLGLGKLGAQAAFTGKLGFGMNVVAWSASLTQEKADQIAEERGLIKGSFKVMGSKKELFEQADVLSVHYVLSERSRGIVGKEELGAMKKSAIVVNTSRGPLIDEDALVGLLEKGAIRGAALDVFETEPLPKDSPWRRKDWGTNGKSQVLISPHMGYAEEETMRSWYVQQAENVERWMKGEEVKIKIG